MLRDLAILSDVVLVSALVLITKSIAKGVGVSISSHAASNRWTYWTFALTLTACGSILSLYLLHDLASEFHLNAVFYCAAILAWVSLLVTAWVAMEDEKNRFKNPHWIAANLLAALMGVMLLCVGFSSSFNIGTRIIATVFALWYFYSLYPVVFNPKAKIMNYYMLIQFFNIISFTTLLLTASYIN